MNLSTTISSSDKGTTASLPWGRWGVRSVALVYLTLMLVIPLLVILRDGTELKLSRNRKDWLEQWLGNGAR